MTWMPSDLGAVRRQTLMRSYRRPYASAGIGCVNAGEDLDQCRLARAVLSDQAMNFAALDRPVDRIKRHSSAEPLADTPDSARKAVAVGSEVHQSSIVMIRSTRRPETRLARDRGTT